MRVKASRMKEEQAENRRQRRTETLSENSESEASDHSDLPSTQRSVSWDADIYPAEIFRKFLKANSRDEGSRGGKPLPRKRIILQISTISHQK